MSDRSTLIRLRPHHFICMRGFKSEGYSQEFVCRMGETISRLHDDPDQIIEVVTGNDDICRYCPRLGEDGLCDCDQKVSVYDDQVQKCFNIHEGRTPFREIQKSVDEHLTEEMLEKICADCQWLDLCLKPFKEEA